MRSCRIINSRSSGVETTEVEVLYEKQQGLKHTHTVGCHGTCTISHAHTRRLHLYNTYSSPVLIPLNSCFSSGPSTLLSHRSPPLYIISAAHRELGLSRQTLLSPTALPRLKLESFSSLLSPPLLLLLAEQRRVYWGNWWPSSLAQEAQSTLKTDLLTYTYAAGLRVQFDFLFFLA